MSLIFYNKEKIKELTRWRWGEEKFGEAVETVADWSELQDSSAAYVLVGIPEDVGVRANYGQPGASKAWKACLEKLCNIQNTETINATNLVILGEIDCTEEMQDAHVLTNEDPFYPTKIGSLVKSIDEKVVEVIEKIIQLNKIPIVIGGGHNNSYGMLKGSSQAFKTPINCVNFDAHTDFRALEHRHSGNGFSYAKEEGFLDNYFIFGIHQNYTSASILESMAEHKNALKYVWFEDIALSEENGFENALKEAKKHVCGSTFGLEMDLDAIAFMGSSAMSPSGFTFEEARRFTRYFSGHKNCAYIHLCEGAPALELFPGQVGKALSYLISDCISKK